MKQNVDQWEQGGGAPYARLRQQRVQRVHSQWALDLIYPAERAFSRIKLD